MFVLKNQNSLLNISQILLDQRTYFKSQSTKDVSARIEILKAFREEIINRESDIYKALEADFKKPKFESYLSEVGLCILQLDLTIKNLHKWSRPKRVKASLLNFPSSDYIYHQPYGAVLVIAPWNYPFLLSIEPLIMAIAAGNTVVLKPSELTANTSQIIEEIVNKICPASLAAVVQGGIPEATELLEQHWDYIFFTGSTKVGKIIARAAAQFMTPVTLELGGKSPCIVDESVNIKLAAKRIVWGKFLNAGQTCIAPDFLIVHSKIKDHFIEALKSEILISYGDNPELSNDFARIINSNNLNRLIDLLNNVKVIHGGTFNRDDHYLSPTLIDEPSLESGIMQEEIFGPILPIISFNSEEELDLHLSKLDTPLSLYVFSNRNKFAQRIINKYSFGAGVINDVLIHFGNHRLPFGGIGRSGMGAYHGKFGFDAFTHQKGIVKKANWLDIPFRYRPYKGKLKGLKWMFKWLS